VPASCWASLLLVQRLLLVLVSIQPDYRSEIICKMY
jgi:hypothetical protein